MATGFNTQTGNGKYHLQFETDNRDYYLLMQETARRCVDGQPFTNADRIRAASDDELAQILCEVELVCDVCEVCGTEIACDPAYCRRATIEWLQQPAEGE